MTSRVAVLGIGRMGAAMARKIAEAEFDVVVWNRSVEPARRLAAECAVEVAKDAAEAVAGADTVISMLADGVTTESVLLAPDVLRTMRDGLTVCDMATSGVATVQRLNEVLSKRGVEFVDAPVSGSVPTVNAGELLVMAGGSPTGVAQAERVMLSFAKEVMYLGAAGTGQAMKLSVNLIVHALNAAVSEALVLATGAGVEASTAYDVFEKSVIAAPFVKYKRQAFLDSTTPPAMTLALSMKDLHLINTHAGERNLKSLVANAALAEVTDACSAGLGQEDMAGLVRYLKQVQSAG